MYIKSEPIEIPDRKYHFFLFIIFLIMNHYQISAQDTVKQKQTFWSNLDSLRVMRIQTGKSLFTPFIAPSYTPELQVLLSVGGLFTFKTEKDNPILERSSIPFSIGYSSNGSLQVNVRTFIYGREDKYRATGEFWIKNMPDHYWGVGYDEARYREKSDSTTRYDRKWWRFYEKFLWRIGKDMYLGGILDLSKTSVSNINPLMEADPYVLESGNPVRNSGLGLVYQYDTRDMGVNAYKGMFIDFSAIFYGDYLGGKSTFQAYELDYRQYAGIGKRHILAWQVKSRFTFGDTPWSELSNLGTPFDLRGYQWGRYRDKSILLGLIEYRHMFNRKTMNKRGTYESRSGMVAWVGMGSLGENMEAYENWLPNVGIGYRLETQPRMNIRIDYGIGLETSAFYISFNEAF